MNYEARVIRFFNADKNEVFKYFTRAEFIEQWCTPEGMTLRVPKFEAKLGGSYRYEHTGKDGLFVCDGYLTEFVPNERLASRDNVKGPDGNILYENLEGVIEFRGVGAGTEVSIFQRGFKDEASAHECQVSWSQCLDLLQGMVEKTAPPRERGDILLDEGQANL